MGEGPALLPPQRPLQGRRSGLLVQALGRTWGAGRRAHLGRTRRGQGGGSEQGHLLKCWSRCLTPRPPTVPETPGP